MRANLFSIVDFDADVVFEALLKVEDEFYEEEEFHGLEVHFTAVNSNGFIDGHNVDDTDDEINEDVINCFAFIVISNRVLPNYSVPSYPILNFKLYLRSLCATFFSSDCFLNYNVPAKLICFNQELLKICLVNVGLVTFL